MTPTYELETQRLRLRAYQPDDLDTLTGLYGDPNVATRTKLGVLSRAECEQVLDGYLTCWRQRGYGMRIISDLDGRPIGECGLFNPESVSSPAMRYVLAADHWGRGYASEAAAATIADAFQRLAFDRLYGFVERENQASHRVLQKAGFQLDRTVESAKGELSRYVLPRAGGSSAPPAPEM